MVDFVRRTLSIKANVVGEQRQIVKLNTEGDDFEQPTVNCTLSSRTYLKIKSIP